VASVANGLGAIEHIVVLMMATRSFDHMLGFLYPDNVSPSGQPFDGLTGTESNPGSNGQPVTVFRIEPTTASAYYMPGADPGEGYMATNDQLYGSKNGPASAGEAATGQGFVKNYAYTLGWESKESGSWPIVAGTVEGDIMGCFTPEALPVLSALAKGYAVCDQWFASAPTETLPNRAFACAATSQGHMDDMARTFSSPTIFGLLGAANLAWAVYGYSAEPLTRPMFTQISLAADSHFGMFADLQAAAAAGTLPPFTFLEPSWGSSGNSQHPPYDVALGEQLIHDVYEALRSGPGWPGTLLVITYDQHGGLFDHVSPPWGAVPPDNAAGEFGFGFDRYGVRVPTVLVSPLIAAGTVYRVPVGGTPLDHTSILKTVEQRWNLPSLTARDAAAPGFGDVLTLTTPRTDDVLAGVTVPVSSGPGSAVGIVSHMESIGAELRSQLDPQGALADAPISATAPADRTAPTTSATVLSAEDLSTSPTASPLRARLRSRLDPAYASDTVEKTELVEGEADPLRIRPDVDVLAAVIASTRIMPPMSIGLFGDWGAGKSFFMNQLKLEVERLSRTAKPDTFRAICPIEFNAWQYASGQELWPAWSVTSSKAYATTSASTSGGSNSSRT
jgi:phospholipase C